MEKSTVTFDNLPSFVNQLLNKVCNIETMLLKQAEKSETSQEDLITVKKASELLGLAESTIRSKVSRRELPYHKPKNSKKLLFSRKELMLYLESGRVKTVDEVYQDASIKIKGGCKNV